jgi:small-conductance mechanosensitive channel
MENIENMNELAIHHGPRIAVGLLIILLVFLVACVIRLVLRRLFRKYEWAGRVGNLLAATIYYAILVLGVLTGLSTMGVDVAPIIAGLGLGGFALGFALRDALSNLLSGVLIIVYHPFKEGDTISVSGCEGTVTETNLRYTVLVNDQERFMVPNSLIFKNPLKIVSERDVSE